MRSEQQSPELRWLGSHRIEVGGVDEVDAGVRRLVEYLERRASSVCLPDVAVPRHRREPDMPVRPNFVSCIAPKYFGLDSRQAAVDRQVDTGDVAALV